MSPHVGEHPSEVVDRVGNKLQKHGEITSVAAEPGHQAEQDGSIVNGNHIAQKEEQMAKQTQQKLEEQKKHLEKKNVSHTEELHKTEKEKRQEEFKEKPISSEVSLNREDKEVAQRGQELKKHEIAEKKNEPEKKKEPEVEKPPAAVSASIPQEKVAKKGASVVEKLSKKTVPEPDYVGWKDVGGWDERLELKSEEEVEDLLSKSTLLESYIGDKFFGDWYHNTALIALTAFFSWIVGRWGGGIGWLTIVLAFTATWYRTSVRRLRRNTRDDVTRVLATKKLETDTETLEWLNSFLTKFWLIYEPVLSEQVVQTANQVLADATPGFIESISLDTFTLGTKPPRIDSVRTFPKTDEDVSVMDWTFSFTPNDIEDLTTRQLKVKVNPKVVLGVRVGKGVVSKSLPILVEDMSFSGLMRVRIKMMTTFPHIQTVDVSFLTPPEIDFVLKPIGGETFGFDINVIPGLSKFIKEMIDSNIGPMLYAPNAFQVNVEQMLAGGAVDAAIGVLSVTVNYAKDIKGSEAMGNTIDPYIKFSFNEQEELCRTSVKSDTRNPTWQETKHLLVKNLNSILTMQVYDFNDHRKDKLLGVVNFPLESLKDHPDQEGVNGEILAGIKNKGGLQFNVHWYPVLESKKLEDGTVEPPPETKSGIVRLAVHQAKDLDAKKSLVGQLSTYAEIHVNKDLIDKSKTVKRNNAPVWENSKEFLCTNRNKSHVRVVVKDSRGMASDPIIGEFRVPLQTLLGAEQGKDWYDMTPSGKIRLEASWSPVAIQDVSGGAYVEPIGVVRIYLEKARGLRNLEKVGKIDPYVRVLQGGFQRTRTPAQDSTLDPDFNHYVYVPIQTPNQELTLDMTDVQKVTKDRSVGVCKVNTNKFIQTDGQGGYKGTGEGLSKLTGELVMPKRGPKGTLFYGVEFIPAMQIMSPEEVAEKRKADKEKEAKIAELKKKAEVEGKKFEMPKSESPEPEGPKAEILSLDEQLKYESGIFGMVIESVKKQAPEGSNIRIYFDKSIYASYTSPKLRLNNNKIMEACDYLVRELEWSVMTIDLVPKDDTKTGSADVLATVTIPVSTVLRNSYEKPYVITLTGKGGQAEVKVRSRYFPTPGLKLDSQERIDNQGNIRLDILEATNVEAADRSGYSDPYCEVRLNGKRVFKTNTIKKTLNPVWNEFCEVDVFNRISEKLELRVFDWDMGPGSDDFLGGVVLAMDKFEPMKPTVLSLPLEGHRGEIKVQVNFKPGYVRQIEDVTERTFTGTVAPGTVMAGVSGAGEKAMGAASAGASAGAHAGKSLLKGAGKLGHKLRHHKDEGEVIPNGDNASNGDEAAVAASGASNGHAMERRQSVTSTKTSSTENGSGSVSCKMTIYSVSGFDSSSIQVRVFQTDKRERELFKSKTKGEEESFSFRAPPDSILLVKAFHHKAIGRSAELGQATINMLEATDHMTLKVGGGDVVVGISRL